MSEQQEQAAEIQWGRRYLDLAEVVILALDKHHRVLRINPKGCRLLGLGEAQVVGRNWVDGFVPEAWRERVRTSLEMLIQDRVETSRSLHYPVLTARGEERLVAWQQTVLTDSQGHIVGSLNSGEDRTEQVREEENLRRSESELRAIVETAVDGIITIDSQGVIQSFNPAAVRIFGYQPGEIIGKSVEILMPEPDRSRHQDYVSEYLRTGERHIIGIGREVVGRRRDGSLFPLHLSVSEYLVDGRHMFTAILRDLSEHKRMQEEMIHAQSLASIGEMAASVAHEIKNPLAGIAGAIEVLQESLPEGDSRRPVMRKILGQVRRLDDLVHDLLLFSKPWKAEKQLYDLRDIVEHVLASARGRALFRGVRLTCRGRLAIPVDPALVEQVLWNLAENAAQAMDGKGEIHFRIERDEMARILVSDTGPGIEPSLQERVLRPFFTTRARGTGLGLAICQKIMSAHGGTIAIESRAGQGTEVCLSFPLT